MHWRFTIDPNSSATVITDPIGWDKAKIKLKRHNIFRGIFVNYITDLVFVTDGYTAIQNYIAANDKCSILEVLIELECDGTYETFFNGAIYLSDIKVDQTECQISAKIEDNNFSQLILRRKDVVVTLDDDYTINGEALSDIGTTMSIHNMNNGNYVYTNQKAFIVHEVLSYITNYITDNDVTFESDFFQTNSNTINHWRLTFDADFESGDEITVKYTNIYGDQITVTQSYASSHAITLLSLRRQLEELPSPLLDEYALYTDTNFARCIDDTSNRTIDCYSILPFTIDSCVVTGGTPPNCTISEEEAYSEGGVNLMLTSGQRMWDSSSSTSKIEITLQEIFDELNKNYNLSLSTKTESGTKKLIIEKLEDIFESSSVATLNNVNGLTYIYDDSFLASSINVGSVRSFNYYHVHPFNDYTSALGTEGDVPLYRKDTWSTQECTRNVVNAKNDFVIDSYIYKYLLQQKHEFLEDKEKDPLMLLESEDSTASPIKSKIYRVAGSGTVTPEDPGNSSYGMNGHLRNINKVYYWSSALTNGTINNKDFSAQFTNPLGFEKLNSFTHKLTKTQVDSILANPNGKIQFSETSSSYTDSWIGELEIDVQSFMGKFDLLTA